MSTATVKEIKAVRITDIHKNSSYTAFSQEDCRDYTDKSVFVQVMESKTSAIIGKVVGAPSYGIRDYKSPLAPLGYFIGINQAAALSPFLKGEEGTFFHDRLSAITSLIETMPSTGEQGGLGDDAIAHLHYFTSGCDFYITEKDAGAADDEEKGVQHQAFGLAVIHEVELGYISLPKIFSVNAELDLYFTPCTIGELRKKHS